jgi:predicted phage-related endonuclease
MPGPNNILHPASREEWLALRQGLTGCSEVAALIGVHPWLTLAQLWAIKSGRLDPDPENPAMRRGRYLEETALRILADEKPDWHVTPNPMPGGSFFSDPDNRLGATPDAFAGKPPDILETGLIQVKSVAPHTFKREWLNDGHGPGAAGEVDIPLHVTVQTLMEMHLTGCTWAVVAALVVDSGITLHVLDVKPIDGLIETLIEKNREFWRFVESGTRPPLDYERDGALIARLNSGASDKTLDLSGDNAFIDAVNEHAACSHDITLLNKRKARAEAEIRDKLGDASGAAAGDFFVSAKIVNRAAHQVAATTYRQLRIKYRGASA